MNLGNATPGGLEELRDRTKKFAIRIVEMLGDCEIVPVEVTADWLKEAHELTAIFSASQRTARAG